MKMKNMLPVLQTPIEYLRGLNGKKADMLKKDLGIFCFKDLLYYFPYRYVDKSHFSLISDISLQPLTYLQFKGRLSQFQIVGERRSRRMTAIFQDSSGSIELVWFHGITYIEKYLQPGKEYIVFGKPQIFAQKYSIIHPEVTAADDTGKKQGIPVAFQPMYNTSEKMKKAAHKLRWSNYSR